MHAIYNFLYVGFMMAHTAMAFSDIRLYAKFCREADMLRVLRLLLNKARSQLRPVLIGTASVADSDYVAAYLRSW